MDDGSKNKRLIRSIAITMASFFVIASLFRLTTAGDLSPAAAPADDSMPADLSEIYDALASDSYDSSTVTADPDGSALQISRCIIARITGGTCP